jgi:hypothetical protein
MEDNFSKLIKVASRESASEVTAPARLEHKVMVSIARKAIEASRRKARRGLVASLTGLAMLLVGGIATLIVWFPVFTPSLNFAWLNKLHIPDLFKGVASGAENTAALSFMEQLGGVVLVLLIAGCTAGFIWCLNSLFTGEKVAEKINESR